MAARTHNRRGPTLGAAAEPAPLESPLAPERPDRRFSARFYTTPALALPAADELFYAHGIAGVVMSDIRDASGVSMRRLYTMCPSKRELVAAWLTERHDTWMAWFTTSVDRHIAAGADPALATFDAIADWVSAPGYRGCAFIDLPCRDKRDR
ncbi:MAG: helix-turn-helix domain-containing protein [Acidimicrobiales bacterium]|nr:helix-turn-helix domain-containing protein [Acidimicrobiales bacterium]